MLNTDAAAQTAPQTMVLESEVKDAHAHRREAKPVNWILDQNTREVVGRVFEWNTGERELFWEDGPRADVIYKET